MLYHPRTVDTELDELLPIAPALAIDGAKGVGKTETAKRRARTTWLLDEPAQREVLAIEFRLAVERGGTIVVDEWQRLPSTWDAVRRAVDDGASPGSFLLTGSATPGKEVDTHSGAGRILSLRMRPMALHERAGAAPTVSLKALLQGEAAVSGTSNYGRSTYFEQIESSGFPGIANHSERLRRGLLETYLQRVIDRDLPDHGVSVRRPETLRRWLAAYAAATATTTSYSRILDATTSGDGSQPAKETTIAYRDHLMQLWLLDPVPGWSPARGAFTRLQQAPKHHLADPALAASLLRTTAAKLASPRDAHLAGPLFESLATLSVRVAAQAARARVGHLRTGNGDREIDLIVEGHDGAVLGVEVKLNPQVTDHDVRHLHWLRREMGDDLVDLIVITTGKYAYRRPDGIAVVPLALLGA